MIAFRSRGAVLVERKIARVSTVPFFLATQLGEQIKYLARAGARLTLVSSHGPELEGISTDNIFITNIEIPRSISPMRDMIALFQLLRCFRQNRFDIVHSTTPKAGFLCALAGALAQVPIRLHTFTGQPWADMKGLVRLVGQLADWIIGQLNTQCYADSESQRDFLITQGLLPSKKLKVLGKGSLAGVDTRRFDNTRWSEAERLALRRELGLSDHGGVILFVGRVTRDKGVRELLKAFEAVCNRGYDIDLLLVGPLDNERGGAINLAGIPRVYHVGYTDCPERYMALANFLCLPSYREGFGTVVIEAAAMGLPTIGTRIYGLSDAVKEEVTGILVPPRDAAALANAMCRMLDEPDHMAKMGMAARLRCLELFDADKVNALVSEEYIRLILC